MLIPPSSPATSTGYSASPSPRVALFKSGRLRRLAVTSGTRSKLLPELPTVAESGIARLTCAPGSMFAPARVPADVLAKLNTEAKRAMQAPEVVRRINLEGAEVVANSPQEFAAEVKAEYAKWQNLVKRPGMKF